MYRKLRNGVLLSPDRTVYLPDGRAVTNPNNEVLKSLGFKEVFETSRPPQEDGFYFESSYQELGDKIVKVWTKVQIPEQPVVEEPIPIETPKDSDLDAAIKILLGKE